MPDTLVKELDPKLRRLLHSFRDPGRLRMDEETAFITAARGPSREGPRFLGAEPAPLSYEKRVLVQLSPDLPPEGFSAGEWHRITEGIYTVDVPITRLAELAAVPQVKFVEAGRPMLPSLDTSVTATRADRVHAGLAGLGSLRGAGVAVGIIDYGFDFAHPDFVDNNGSRIAFLWDQELAPVGTEQSPAEFAYGVEYTRADITAALGQLDPFTAVRHRLFPQAHGTHVAGIAAGNGRAGSSAFPAGRCIGTAPEATLICVQPKREAGIGTFADSIRVADAIDYIYGKARQLGLPCVINMSLGQNGGSHDGESVVERAIDRLLEVPGRAFVVAAGNEHVWRTHASGTLSVGAIRTLNWRFGGPIPGLPATLPGAVDRTVNELEIWYSSRDVFEVRVIDPTGAATAAVAPGANSIFTLGSGHQAYIDSERFTVLNGDARIYIEVTPRLQPFQPGAWRVELRAVEARNGRFDAWIERDLRDEGNRFADQSFFEGADFDATMTLGTPATGRRAIVVANYDHRTGTPSSSSGRGPTRDRRHKPECAAPGTNITSSCSLGGRTYNGAAVPVRFAISGTSMAAPHVAGIVALLLGRRRNLTAEQIRKILTASARPVAATPDFDEA